METVTVGGRLGKLVVNDFSFHSICGGASVVFPCHFCLIVFGHSQKFCVASGNDGSRL